jgi:hypothetical protein
MIVAKYEFSNGELWIDDKPSKCKECHADFRSGHGEYSDGLTVYICDKHNEESKNAA